MPHPNLQAAQSSDITRILERDHRCRFTAANIVGDTHAIFGDMLRRGIPVFLGILMAAPLLFLDTDPVLFALTAVIAPTASWVVTTFLLYGAYQWMLRSLSVTVEGRYGVRLCAVGNGRAIVEHGSGDLSGHTDMRATHAYLDAHREAAHA